MKSMCVAITAPGRRIADWWSKISSRSNSETRVISPNISACPMNQTSSHDKTLRALSMCWLGFAVSAAAEPVKFSAMGCGPYTKPDKPAAAFYVQQENRERTSEFMVHLGDVFKKPLLKKPEAGAASPATKPSQPEPPGPDEMPTEAEYRWTADLLARSN